MWQQETVRTHDVHCWQVPCPDLQLSASSTIHCDDWKRTEDGCLSVDERAQWEMGDDRSSLLAVWQRHELIRTQLSKLCNQWVDSCHFCCGCSERCRTVPPSMEGHGALGAMLGACPIPDVDGRDRWTCWWWDVLIMWSLEGISPFFWWRLHYMGWERYSVGFGVRNWPPGDVWRCTAKIPWSEIVCDGKYDRDFLCSLLALDNAVVPWFACFSFNQWSLLYVKKSFFRSTPTQKRYSDCDLSKLLLPAHHQQWKAMIIDPPPFGSMISILFLIPPFKSGNVAASDIHWKSRHVSGFAITLSPYQ